jgi:hypothetical protein
MGLLRSPRIMTRLPSLRFSSRSQANIAATVVLLVLCLLPFAGALEVHHIFSEVDHDGHEHSDFDLCQWVQAHSSGSLDLDHGHLSIPLQVDQEKWGTPEAVFSSIILISHESRGPPVFL